MADPAWFFSTLAQSTAAIIGFIIAFSAVLYQLDRQRRERRTQDLRERLLDFEEKYSRVVGDAEFLLINSFEFIEYDSDNETIIIDSDDPEAQKIYDITLGFHTISNTLGRLDHSPNPQFDYLFSEEEFEELGENINNLADVFAVQNYRIRECIQSLTGIPQDEIWDAPSFGERVDYAEEAVPAPHSDNIHDWLADETTPRSPNITGQNLRSLNQITRRLDRDFSELEAKKGNTLVGYEPDVKYPLFLSGLLLVIGVFLPMLFIMSPPSQLLQLDRTTIYIVQWVLVLGTLISSLNLLRLLANRISGSS